MARGNTVQSVEKAMKILDVLMESGTPLSLAEISEATQWPKSTVHALLNSMRESFVVEQQDSDGKYMLGYRLFELGSQVCNSWDVVKYARSPMLHMASKMNMSIYLARLIEGKLLLIACEEPNEGFRVYDKLGSELPLHCTSQGKAILAYKTPSEIKYLLGREGLRPYTENSITDIQQFLSQRYEIRDNGYALEKGEYVSGLYSYAAPIFDQDRHCEYAIACVGTYQVMEPFGTKQEKARVTVVQAAAEISRLMGYHK